MLEIVFEGKINTKRTAKIVLTMHILLASVVLFEDSALVIFGKN